MTTPAPHLQLQEPSLALLPAYAAALERGWSPASSKDISKEQLEAIRADASAFIADCVAQTGIVKLPDGSEVPKLPNRVRWMWDGELAGQIGLRWQHSTDALPDHVLGHIGYAVVPWKRRRGYATEALRLMLVEARSVGLVRVEVTADVDNIASRRVIEANGGRLIREFVSPRHGPEPKILYFIDLDCPTGLAR
jgi:predicted acetyltransferase